MILNKAAVDKIEKIVVGETAEIFVDEEISQTAKRRVLSELPASKCQKKEPGYQMPGADDVNTRLLLALRYVYNFSPSENL